jgi:hypothetical protein
LGGKGPKKSQKQLKEGQSPEINVDFPSSWHKSKYYCYFLNWNGEGFTFSYLWMTPHPQCQREIKAIKEITE